jgi:hypothetical protein
MVCLFLAMLLIVLSSPGCAIFFRRNTPTFNFVEEKVVPENDIALIATLPITLPLGLLALVIDQFVVRPANIVGDVGDATQEIFWNDDWLGDQYLGFVASSPFRLLGSAIFAPVAFVVVTFFDVEGLGE